MTWHKSTFSGSDPQSCVEVWRKSTFSGSATQGECVEFGVDADDGNVRVRDTKDRDGAVLSFTPGEWTAFLEGVRAGEFDL